MDKKHITTEWAASNSDGFSIKQQSQLDVCLIDIEKAVNSKLKTTTITLSLEKEVVSELKGRGFQVKEEWKGSEDRTYKSFTISW